MLTPELRKASSRSRCSSVAKSYSMFLKVSRGGEERHFGAAPAIGLADHLQRRDRIAMGEFDVMLLAVAPDPQAAICSTAR